MGVDARCVEPHRADGAGHLDHLPDVPVVLELRLGARRAKDGLVEGRRRLLQLAQRRRHAPRLVQRRFLLAALGAAGEVALHLRGASRIELAIGEVEEQVLGLGVRHALPSLTSTTGSSEAASSETPAAASALRNPSSA